MFCSLLARSSARMFARLSDYCHMAVHQIEGQETRFSRQYGIHPHQQIIQESSSRVAVAAVFMLLANGCACCSGKHMCKLLHSIPTEKKRGSVDACAHAIIAASAWCIPFGRPGKTVGRWSVQRRVALAITMLANKTSPRHLHHCIVNRGESLRVITSRSRRFAAARHADASGSRCREASSPQQYCTHDHAALHSILP